MIKFLKLFLLLLPSIAFTQNKKPLDHSVYDGWKSVGERMISNDGKYVVYAINPQEGDGSLVLQNRKSGFKLEVPRAYSAVITQDSRYAVFKIKPAYQDTRQAKIKKKKPDDMPKDSLAIVELGKDSILKIGRVKSYKTPQKGSGWVAYLLDKPLPDTSAKKKLTTDSAKVKIDMLAKAADSVIRKSLDSVKGKIDKEKVIAAAQKAVKEIYKKAYDDIDAGEHQLDAEGDDPAGAASTEGTELVLRNLLTGAEKKYKLVSEYYFDKKGTKLLIETTKNAKDSNSKALVLLYNLSSNKLDTIMKGFNDAKNFSFDEDGRQLAFVAERDSSAKALQKFYKLWYYTTGKDSASLKADVNTIGMRLGSTVSENGNTRFSRDGKKLFFGVADIKPARDTTLVDFELARLDVWHYNDDYLQPMQLKQLADVNRRNFTAMIFPGATELVQLSDDSTENVAIVDEGNADWVLAQSTKGNRLAMQWEGRTKTRAYYVDIKTGKRKFVAENAGFFSASPSGKYIGWYNAESKNYFVYDVATQTTKNITETIKEPIYNIENDVPDLPGPIGNIGWMENDKYYLVRDVHDIWQVDPTGKEQPRNLTNGYGKKNKTVFEYLRTDPEKRYFTPGETLLLGSMNKENKNGGFYSMRLGQFTDPVRHRLGAFDFTTFMKAKDADEYLTQLTTSQNSELYAGSDLTSLAKLTNVAKQQEDFNWMSAELVKWKMFDGKMSEGLLYKPENFDPKKKYPIIFYFYERDADNLNRYISPSPSASTINIPYFVSNGYLVFDPNIYYKTGQPGESAYNSVVSAAKHLAKMPWVDSTRMGIQGQSWGGYQVAYLVTRTNMFRAAGAGAPVSNMTSAYGGIRWGTGMNRQFQYEKSQSRIGATLWQRPDLYIKNSPLFTADKVNTPILIMHNDQDGAVPWYQGIEFFTALRRLNKKVWMLQYNGEDHNLVERKNRKDLSVRLGQFFDYYLKDAKPARWITDGVPATEKGRDWGLGVE